MRVPKEPVEPVRMMDQGFPPVGDGSDREAGAEETKYSRTSLIKALLAAHIEEEAGISSCGSWTGQ
jgi:hypothetical protein